MGDLVHPLLDASFAAAMLSCFVLTVISAIVPWVNAEVMVLALPSIAPSPAGLVVLVLVATAGQMAGKCVVYWAGRGGVRVPSARVTAVIERWRDRQIARRSSPLMLVLVSSAIGIPPFYVITALAGILKVSFPRYLLFGTIGRLVRFGLLVLIPYSFTAS